MDGESDWKVYKTLNHKADSGSLDKQQEALTDCLALGQKTFYPYALSSNHIFVEKKIPALIEIRLSIEKV